MAEQMTKSEAMEIVAKAEARRLERNQKLREWRADPKNGYKEYYKNWLIARDAKIAEAKKLLGQ